MKDLTQGNTFKELFKFSIPLIISGIVSQSYNMIDLIIAGKVIGNDALSATGCTSTLIQFLSSLFWGFGVATSALIGKLYGAKENKRIVLVIKTTTLFIAITMFILCLMFFLLSNNVMEILKVDKEIIDPSNNYFKLYMIALFFQAITYIFTCTLQSIGNSKYPMIMTLVSGLGNLLLNILFVSNLSLGINGLAYATIISCFISLLMGLIKIIKTLYEFNGDIKFQFSFSELKNVSYLAIPCILQQCSLYLASVVVQPLINNLGKSVSAGYSIAMNVNVLLNAVYHSISRAVATYASQSKGSKQYSNYKKGIYIGIIQQLILTLPLLIICVIFKDKIFLIFMKDNDTTCLPYAIQYVDLCVPFVIFCALGNLMHSFYKSIGSVITVLITTTIFTITRITLSYTLPNTNLISNIYLALSIAWVVEATILMLAFYLGFWKKAGYQEKE